MVPGVAVANFSRKRKANDQDEIGFSKKFMPPRQELETFFGQTRSLQAPVFVCGSKLDIMNDTTDPTRDSISCNRCLAWEDTMVGVAVNEYCPSECSSFGSQPSGSDQGVKEFGAAADFGAHLRFAPLQHTCRLRGFPSTLTETAMVGEACNSLLASDVSSTAIRTWGTHHHCQPQQHREERERREPDADEWGWFVDAEEDQHLLGNKSVAQSWGTTPWQAGLFDEGGRERPDIPTALSLRRT